MSHSYYELHYHLVWATKLREPTILPEIRERLYLCIRRKSEELGCKVHAVGGISDHVHLELSIPATLPVAKVVHDVKGSSSHLINSEGLGIGLHWQPGYGAISIRKKDVPIVCGYINEQEQRHSENRLWAELEKTTDDINRTQG